MNDRQDQDEDGPQALATDLVIPALGSGLAIYFLVSTRDLTWEARATGTSIAAILLGLCLLLAVRTALALAAGRGRLDFGDLFANDLFNRQRVGLMGLLVLFIATIGWLGTTLGMFLLLVGAMLVMGVRDIRKLLGIALASSATVYLLFIYLLHSRLPKGLLEEALARLLPPLGG